MDNLCSISISTKTATHVTAAQMCEVVLLKIFENPSFNDLSPAYAQISLLVSGEIEEKSR